MPTVNLNSTQAQGAIEMSAFLKGILQVLVDMHCKDMTPEEIADYEKELNKIMGDYRKGFLEATKAL